MCGHERKLMWLGLGESIANLVISLTLVLIFKNIICVAIGSLIPSFYYGWFHLWPWMAKDVGVSSWTLFKRTTLTTLLASLPLLALLTAVQFLPALKFEKAWLTLLTHGPLAGLLAIILMWRFALTQNERVALSRKLPRFARPQAQPEIA